MVRSLIEVVSYLLGCLNSCFDEGDSEIIYDNDIFENGLFTLKLTVRLEIINATVVQDYEVVSVKALLSVIIIALIIFIFFLIYLKIN